MKDKDEDYSHKAEFRLQLFVAAKFAQANCPANAI